MGDSLPLLSLSPTHGIWSSKVLSTSPLHTVVYTNQQSFCECVEKIHEEMKTSSQAENLPEHRCTYILDQKLANGQKSTAPYISFNYTNSPWQIHTLLNCSNIPMIHSWTFHFDSVIINILKVFIHLVA